MDFKGWMNENYGGPHYTTVYHVSPTSGLYKLRPQGKRGTHTAKQDKPGVYVAPSFRDAVAWYVSFVKWKKEETQRRKFKKFRKKGIEKDRSSYHNAPMYYQDITIYKCVIPTEILKKSWHDSWWEKEYINKSNNF